MADEKRLKEVFQTIDTHDEEMDAMRARLALRLEQESLPQQEPIRAVVTRWLPMAAILLFALVLINQNRPRVTLTGLEPDVLIDMAAVSSPLIAKQVDILRNSEDPFERDAARVILCQQLPETEALAIAMEGVQETFSHDYRSFYLEYLIDHGESVQVSEALVENMLDIENDPTCAYLLRELLKFSVG